MRPRLLLVEDDPTSRAFLQAATELLPAQVDVAASVAEAMAFANRHPHALWLVDANLPDGSGAELLARLRAAGLDTPAIAHTASHEPAEHDALRAAGFAATIAKPLPADAWLDAIRSALDGEGSARSGSPPASATDGATPDLQAIPVWDDAIALTALGGNADHVAAMRRLFLDELPDVRDTIERAVVGNDDHALHGALHRLRASCGFVGAARLDAAANGLRGADPAMSALPGFLAAAQDTLSS